MIKVELKILRFLPEVDKEPHWESYMTEAEPTDRVLDALIYAKDHLDGSLTFRRSCAHGVCGSDAMMINGKNMLACKTLIQNCKTPITIAPMKGFKVIKDLTVDMEPFFAKYRSVKPYLIAEELPAQSKERKQSPEELERFEDTTKCILCAACTTSCPTFWLNPEYVGPQAIVAAHRFLLDSRDTGKEERIEEMAGKDGVFRCRTVTNCLDACPRDINIVKAIAEVRQAVAKKLV